MSDLLDHCWIHGDALCDCLAYLVAMGCMDLLMEQWLEADPGFGAVLMARLRGRDTLTE